MGVVILDLDDTLIADVAAAEGAIQQVLFACDVPAEEPDVGAALTIARKAWKVHPHRRAGALADVSAWESMWLPRVASSLPQPVAVSLREHEIRVWAAVLSALGGDPGHARAAAEAYRTARTERVAALPGAVDALDQLGEQHLLWLATNGLPAHQRAKVTRAGLEGRFDQVLISGEVGCPKANPAFADAVASLLTGLQVCLVVGDSIAQDLQLAANGGWPAVHLCGQQLCSRVEETRGVTHAVSLTEVSCRH